MMFMYVLRKTCYARAVIGSFKKKDLERIFNGETPKKISKTYWRRLKRVLVYLEAARGLKDIEALGMGLEKVKNVYHLRVAKQVLLSFRLEHGVCLEVSLGKV
jgi:plasmid maintenance system killer protein